MLENATNITVTLNSFQSRSKRRYIGIGATFLCYLGFTHSTLAHREVLTIHEDSNIGRNIDQKPS